jgi:hypothetical protein
LFDQGGIAALTSVLRLRVVEVTDKRVTLMNEVIGAMKLVKMYAWEDPFRQRILNIRKQVSLASSNCSSLPEQAAVPKHSA